MLTACAGFCWLSKIRKWMISSLKSLHCLLVKVVLATAYCTPSSLSQLRVTEPNTSRWSFSELETAGSMSADGGMLGIAGYGSDAESDIVVESQAAPEPDAAAGPVADAGQHPFSKLACRAQSSRAGQGQACSKVPVGM